jgi:Radical SAM superfamily.
VTDKCNLHCKHCSVNNITAVVHPYEQIKKEMQQLYDMGVRILFFCGGETFLWKDGERNLRDLVIEAKQMGFLIVNVGDKRNIPH